MVARIGGRSGQGPDRRGGGAALRTLATGLATLCLLGTGAGAAPAADLDGWDVVDVVRYADGGCLRTEAVVDATLVGTNDDTNGFDTVAALVISYSAGNAQMVDIPVGQTRTVRLFMSVVGRSDQSTSVSLNLGDAEPGTEMLTPLASVDVDPVQQSGQCDLDVGRIGGANRAETAALLSAQRFVSADTVLVATSTSYPDALTAGPLAVQLGAPILLTSPTSLSPATRAELLRLGPTKVVVVGGTSSVSGSVRSAISAALPDADVSRLAGADRYGTSAQIAGLIEQDSSAEAYIASGETFPDALVLSALAASHHAPLLLVKSTSIPAPTAAALASVPFDHLYAAGGTTTISAAVVSEAAGGAPATRFAGADRYATSAAVLATFPAREEHWGRDRVFVATGESFPDSLTAVPAAHGMAPIALTRHHAVPSVVLRQIARLTDGALYPLITIAGGPGSVSQAVQDQLTTLVGER